MATVIQSVIARLHEKISVTLQTTDYMPAFDKALKAYAKKASLPGFRQGLVPAGMVKKMYGANIFNDEILRTAGAEIEKYIAEKKLKLYGRPLPLENGNSFRFDMNNPQEYTFDFEVGLQSDFELPLLENAAPLEALKVIVTEQMVNDEVEKACYNAGKLSDIDTIAHEDDVLNITFLANGAAADDAGKQTNSLLIKYFSTDMQAKLMGKQVGDTVEIILGSAFDEKVLPAIIKDLGLNPADESAKGLYYNMTIDKIGHVDKAVLDAGLYEDIYKGAGITTEQEFRDRLKSEIQGYWDGQGRNKLHNDIFETLVHNTHIDIPTKFMKRWVSEGGEKYKPMHEVEADWNKFDHSMRWELICTKVAAQYNIQVTKDEIETGIRNTIKQYFAQMGMMADMNTDEDWMQDLVTKQMQDRKATDEIYNQVMTDKLFGLLETKFTVNFKEASLEEFLAAPSKHHHHH